MTVIPIGAPQPPLLHTTDELITVLGIPFSEQQLAAITAPLQPAAVIAGAGSGKTTVMAARVVWLVGTGQVRPEEVLGLTFTNKAAAELAHRVRDALARLTHRAGGADRSGAAPPEFEELVAEPEVSTYHAYAGRLVAEHGLRLGVERGVRLVADASRFQLVTAVIRKSPEALSSVTHSIPNLAEDVLSLDSELSDHLCDTHTVRAHHHLLRLELGNVTKELAAHRALAGVLDQRDELLGLVDEYAAHKDHLGVCEFADQMALGARLAIECCEVGAAERDRFRVVLLDEYQDTSVAQRRMLTGLFSGPDAESGRGFPVTAVGDPCQSIYGWRGASVANLDDFGEHFPTAQGEESPRYQLNVNRRCGRVILDLANEHAKPLYALHTGVAPLVAPDDDPNSGQIRAALFDTRDAEYEWVAEQVLAGHARHDWSDIGVLVRSNAELSALYHAMAGRGIPVEVVGLGGLLQTPAVADLVATLRVIADATDNPSMQRLLTGPRWRIGPRDLLLLAARARQLVDPRGDGVLLGDDEAENTENNHGTDSRDSTATTADNAAAEPTLATQLADVMTAMDPTELACLGDAIADPGPLAFSPQARERFGLLAVELAGLRRHTTEPLQDLVRRVLVTTGLDIELTASAAVVASGAAEEVAAFLDVVGQFSATDSAASLDGLLAYLKAEERYADGLDLAIPSGADSVKLLTVHRAKGLEWPVVFVPGLSVGVFPSGQGRPRPITQAKVLPWELRGDADAMPELGDLDAKGTFDRFVAESRDLSQLEERRLGYVGFTRAKQVLVCSGHHWAPAHVKPRGPSEYLDMARRFATESGDADPWCAEPSEVSPYAATEDLAPWPVPRDQAVIHERAEAISLVQSAIDSGPDPDAEAGLLLDELAIVDRWDSELRRLVTEFDEAAAGAARVPLPASLAATQVLRLLKDPDGFAADLARPMPRRPNPRARFGSRFHQWVESYFGTTTLLDPDDLPGAADEEIADDTDLAALTQAFRTGRFGSRTPDQVEAPFAVRLGGRVIRGRIDAVYHASAGEDLGQRLGLDLPDGCRALVVDWKTNRAETADPLQLAIYRVACADLAGVESAEVATCFYYVRDDRADVRLDLPDREALSVLLAGPVTP